MLGKGKTKKIQFSEHSEYINYPFFCESFTLASDFWILLKSKHILLTNVEPLKILLSTEPPLPTQTHFSMQRK